MRCSCRSDVKMLSARAEKGPVAAERVDGAQAHAAAPAALPDMVAEAQAVVRPKFRPMPREVESQNLMYVVLRNRSRRHARSRATTLCNQVGYLLLRVVSQAARGSSSSAAAHKAQLQTLIICVGCIHHSSRFVGLGCVEIRPSLQFKASGKVSASWCSSVPTWRDKGWCSRTGPLRRSCR